MGRAEHGTIAIVAVLALGFTLFGQSSGVGGPPSNRTGGRGGENPGVRPQNTLPYGVSETSRGVFRIKDTRPLEVAMSLVSRKLGIPISYEEPAWVSSADVISAVDYPGNEKMSTRTFPRGPLIPRGGSFDIVIPTNNAANSIGLIQSALSDHRSFNNPGEFKLITFGEGEFAVVPDRAEDKDRKMVPQESPFEARITLPEQERTFSETVEAVLQAVRSTRRVAIYLPFSLSQYDVGPGRKYRLGANNEVAREVLAKVLRVPGRQKFAWNLRYDPQDKFYAFNLVSVKKEVEIPGGGTGLQSVLWSNESVR